MNEVTISIERYNELLKKEVAYEIRRAELIDSSWVNQTDRVLYGIPTKEVE